MSKKQEKPKKLDDFMYALMKKARSYSFMEFLESWGIDFDTEYMEIENWFKSHDVDINR